MLSLISGHVKPEIKDKIITHVIKIMFNHPNIEFFHMFISRIKPFLTNNHVNEMLGYLEQSNEWWIAFESLKSIENMLMPEQLDWLIDRVSLEENVSNLANLISIYGTRFTEKQHQKVLEFLLDMIRADQKTYYSVDALINFLSLLKMNEINQVFIASENITTLIDRAKLLCAISQTTKLSLGLEEILNIIPSLEKVEDKFTVAALLAPQIDNPDIITRLFGLVSVVDDLASQSITLAALSERINDLNLDEIEFIFGLILETLDRNAITSVMRLLNSNQREILANVVLSQADDKFSEILPVLVMHIERDTQQQFLNRVLKFTDINKQVDLLAFLVVHLTSEIGDLALREGLLRLNDMTDMYLYGIATCVFSQRLDPVSRHRLIKNAVARIESDDRSTFLKVISLVELLPTSQEPEITKIHQRVFEYIHSTKMRREEIIESIARNLDHRWLNDAIEVAINEPRPRTAANTLNNLSLSKMRTTQEKSYLAQLAYTRAIEIKNVWGRIQELSRCAIYLPEEKKLEAIEKVLTAIYSLGNRHQRIGAILEYWQFLRSTSDYRNRFIREIADYCIHELYRNPRSLVLGFITQLAPKFSSETAHLIFNNIQVICKKWVI